MIRSPFTFNSLPPGVKWLLIINGVLYLLQQFFTGWLLSTFGLTPYLVLNRFHIWQLFTYMFLHGSFFHILFNMFALWMFGKELEYTWGTREFIKFYIVCGLGAGLFNTLFEPFSLYPIIGASGAIYGILVAFAIVFPTTVIYLYGLIPLQAKHFVMLVGLLEFFASFHGTPSTIARLAHLGGMLTGYLYLKSYNFRSILNRMINRASDFIVTNKPKPRRIKPPTKEDLLKDVDKILEKVLLHGADSLTEKEREIMRRYSKRHEP